MVFLRIKRDDKMKKLMTVILIMAFVVSGCTVPDNEQKTEIIDYLNKKYNESFTLVKYSAGKERGGSPTIMYVKDKNKRDAVIKVYLKDGSKQYLDSYIAALKEDDVRKNLSEIFVKYFSDFEIETNMYKCIYYDKNDVNVSVADYLSNQSNGMRIMFYIKTDDSVEDSREKIQSFTSELKDKKIYIDSFYFAFFEKDSDAQINNIVEDYTFEYAIDCISRNDKFKSKITDQYFSVWESDKNRYNYVSKM